MNAALAAADATAAGITTLGAEEAADPAAAWGSPDGVRRRLVAWRDPLASAREGARLSGLDYLRAIFAGEIPPAPIGVLMRFAPVEVEVGRAVFEGTPGEEHYNPIGVVHGGYASTLLDSAMGCAVHSTLPAGVAYTTQTIEVKLVRPISADTGTLRCEAEIIHRGRRQATAQARIVAVESGKLLATGTSTCMILE